MLTKGVTTRKVHRGDGPQDDRVAVEEPLEIRLATETIAVTMRTPGDDHRLALGFLFAEGLLKGRGDVGSVAHCGTPGEEGFGNVIDVTLAPGVRAPLMKLDASRRGTLTTAACGVCGRRTIDDLLSELGPVPQGPQVDPAAIRRAPHLLRMVQPNFSLTGGVHCAAVLDARGEILASAEDVGRHNAVDKAVGALLQAGTVPARRGEQAPAALLVSGRASFEIVQKAAAARLGVVASISAASSLAVDLASRMNLTLVTFVRDGHFNLYTHPERLQPGVG